MEQMRSRFLHAPTAALPCDVGKFVTVWEHLLQLKKSKIFIRLQSWTSCVKFYRTVFLENARFLGWMPLFVYFGLSIVSCSMVNILILGSLWPLVFVLNNILILGICHSTISHLPGCFGPWIFIQNIGFNMVPSDSFMSHLANQLGYSAKEFQVLQLIVLAAFGVVD